MALPFRVIRPEAISEADAAPEDEGTVRLCGLPAVPERELPAGLDPNREALIRHIDKKWVNGTALHYYFFDRETDGRTVRFTDGSERFVSWVGRPEQRQAVRHAFDTWKQLGLGLRFVEVSNREEAEIRIAFDPYDGSWSHVGRDNIDVPEAADPNRPTMNFGWDLTTPYGRDTALHEIGHALGFPHEHQNPLSGIVWDEEKVYAWAERTQGWNRATTLYNILRKIEAGLVEGTPWDPDSIMHYRFPAGLTREPAKYRAEPLLPAGGLSPADIRQARLFYPPLEAGAQDRVLRPLVSERLTLGPGEQADFVIRPDVSRKYTIQTFGDCDTVMVLFEERDGEPRYMAGDDDSGTDRNARLEVRLYRGGFYRLRIRLYGAWRTGETAVMMW